MDAESEDLPAWKIFAAHDPSFKIPQRFKRKEGAIAADNVMSEIKAIVLAEPEISIVDEI